MVFPVRPPEGDPEVVRVMREFKAAILAREEGQMAQMGRRWLEMEERLAAQIELLAREAVEQGALRIGKVVELERARSLLAQIEAELANYEDYAVELIRLGQEEMIEMGIGHAEASIGAVYRMNGVLAGGYFDLLPVNALEHLVGLAGDGSPLRDYLEGMYPEAVQGLMNALTDGIVRGLNPREVARNMRQGFGVGINRALNTARTEQLRIYREANRQQYQASGVVEGYQRLSARDDRVCAACLMADDGRVYPLDEPFAEHNQGRCAPVPVVRGFEPPKFEKGADWFERQDPAVQEKILGKERFALWEAGAFELGDLVSRRRDGVWGDALVPRSVRSLTADS